MAFELAAYGLISGLLCRRLPKNAAGVYASLAGAMVGGRMVSGAVRALITLASPTPFGLAIFWTEAVLNAIPGIPAGKDPLVLPPARPPLPSPMTALEQMCAALSPLAGGGGRVLDALDGPCASGKTTLAGQAARQLAAPGPHGRLFLPPARPLARLAQPGGKCDWERV